MRTRSRAFSTYRPIVLPGTLTSHGLAQHVKRPKEIERFLFTGERPPRIPAEVVDAVQSYELSYHSPMRALCCLYRVREEATIASYATLSRDTRALTGVCPQAPWG